MSGVYLVIAARTSAGSRQEYELPGVRLEDAMKARAIIELEHKKLRHHLNSDGSEREDQGFAGFVRECVPQAEARSILERAGPTRVPPSVLQVFGKDGVNVMWLLYALTLRQAKSRTRPGVGVWLGEEGGEECLLCHETLGREPVSFVDNTDASKGAAHLKCANNPDLLGEWIKATRPRNVCELLLQKITSGHKRPDGDVWIEGFALTKDDHTALVAALRKIVLSPDEQAAIAPPEGVTHGHA